MIYILEISVASNRSEKGEETYDPSGEKVNLAIPSACGVTTCLSLSPAIVRVEGAEDSRKRGVKLMK